MSGLVVDQVLSGADLGLSAGLSDLLILDIGGRRVVYALSRSEHKLVELTLSATGALTVDGAMNLSGTFAAGSEPLLGQVALANGDQRLMLAGMDPGSGQSVTLSTTGALGAQSVLTGVGLPVAPISMAAGGTPTTVSGRLGAGGLDLFADTGGGFGWSAGIDDAADRYLADVSASANFALAGSDYVVTASGSEDGLNVVRVQSGSLEQSGALGITEGLPVGQPTDVAVAQRMGETLVMVTASASSSLSVAWVDDNGVPRLADHVLDSESTFIQGAATVSATTFGDFVFVGAGGVDGGVSLFTVLPGGRLVHLDSHADDAATSLYRVSSLELTVAGSALQFLATSLWEPGLTRLSYDLSDMGFVGVADTSGAGLTGGAGSDQLVGSAVAEVLSGGGGDDILLDGAGADTLIGGPGADLFAFVADGLTDTVLDFDRTSDRLDLSAFDFLYDVSQLVVTPTTTGAILSHGIETVVIVTADALPLTAAELTNDAILNVDRPPVLPFGQELIGGAGPDRIEGAAGADTMFGNGGDDVLLGLGGADVLSGGDGADTLDGGGGNDTLNGDLGDDLLVGGEGSDLINGGDGADIIYGDAHDWDV